MADAKNVCNIECEKDSYMVVVTKNNDGQAEAKAFYRPNSIVREEYPQRELKVGENVSVLMDESGSGSGSGSGMESDAKSKNISAGLDETIKPVSEITEITGGKMRRRSRSRVTRNRKYHRRNRRTARRGSYRVYYK